MKIDRSQFLETFFQEAQTLLSLLNQKLVQLEARPGQKELLSELFRAAHTLKGSARMMGFRSIQDIAHAIEDYFSLLQGEKILFDSQAANKLFRAVDQLQTALDRLRDGGKDLEELRIDKVVGGLKELVQSPSSLHDSPLRKSDADFKAEQTASARQSEYLSVPLHRMNQLLDLAGELVLYRVHSSDKADELKRLNLQIKQGARLLKGLVGDICRVDSRKGPFHPLRSRPSKTANAENRISEKLESFEAFFHYFSTTLRKLSDDIQTQTFQLNPLVDRLQEKIRQIRMLPCSALFEGFPRLVRDLAQEQKKKVSFLIQGEETELDKRVLEHLRAPLLHLIRNAMDHGIEPEEERLQNGKKKEATLTLDAFQKGGKVVLTLTDDGRGIELEKVGTKALEKKLVSHDQLEKMRSAEILNLIFKEGFSTAPSVSELSGRGIGLSVVQAAVDQLQGTIQVESERSKGTTFRLEIPLTLSILQVLLVQAGESIWAFPVSKIEKCFQLPSEEVQSSEQQKWIYKDGCALPLFALSELLSFSSVKKNGSALLIALHNRKIALAVDKILKSQEVFLKDLPTHLGKVPGVHGATLLANGELVPILDIDELVRLHSIRCLPSREERRTRFSDLAPMRSV